MRRPGIYSRRIVALLGLGALLSGCAAWQVPSSPPPPASGITANDLKTAIHDAYHRGFEAGRHYQRELDWRRFEAPKAASLNQKPEPASALPQPDAQTPPLPAAQAQEPNPALPSKAFAPAVPPQPAPLPPLPPSSNYTTSGPAQPLSQ
ncbi:MAG: hypothetical protein KGH75_03890 [Rhodospirillales bacterium]|nr:hypothetical protein [Rhodospirillales bacterium]